MFPDQREGMDCLMQVVSEIHRQWGIDCKLKDFILAVLRLLKLGVIDRPVDILHLEIWEKCTKALVEETMSSGSGKNLKSWGKVVQALQKARQVQETWKSAQTCLLAMPLLEVGVTMQTADEVDPAKRTDAQSQELPPRSLGPDLPSEGGDQARSFWHGLAEEARNAAITSETEADAEMPVHMFKNGAEPREDGRGADAGGGNAEGSPNGTGRQEGGETARERLKTNQSARFKSCPYKARTSPSRRRGEPRGRERPDPRKKGRGRSPRKRLWSPETPSQSTFGSESSSSWVVLPVTVQPQRRGVPTPAQPLQGMLSAEKEGIILPRVTMEAPAHSCPERESPEDTTLGVPKAPWEATGTRK
ncbi:uncharacterized protein LOC117005027 [Catharus ustulatus]|uniref:uncharacterized protein LOC117005027 n=1 Tax=Catharus ustulatus TaxID=91951 RepID=UPI00140CDFDD|nr:uncharacterized protein LOC117005027 [Catharus ustulatus]